MTWSTKDVRWRTPIPGIGHASPVVWGERVYVTTALASGTSTVDIKVNDKVEFATDLIPHKWQVLAIDRRSGRVLWDCTIQEGTPGQARHVRASYANATPATEGRFIVAPVFQYGVVCLDRDGRVRWTKEIKPDNPKFALDPASSPVIVGDLVIVQNDFERNGSLVALDLATGRQVWTAARNEGMTWSTPAVYRAPDGSMQIIANSPRWVRAYDARTGEEIWRMNNSTAQPWDRIPAPVIAGDRIVITGGGPERPIYAIRADARGDITLAAGERANRHVIWSTERGAPYMATPLVVDGLIYVLGNNGVLTVHDANDGSRIYQQRVAEAGTNFSASPIAASGRVYITSEDGDVFAVKTGRAFQLAGKGSIAEPVFATPAISGRLLVARGLKTLTAVGRA